VFARSGLDLAVGLQVAWQYKPIGMRHTDDCHDISYQISDSTIAEVYRNSHDTIQKGTNNCEIPAMSIITLQNKLLPTYFCVNLIV